jgi:hypothetical protein
MTNKQAIEIIKANKDNTAFFGTAKSCITGEPIIFSYDEIYETLRQAQFGKAETLTIIASLKLSGANFSGNLTLDY